MENTTNKTANNVKSNIHVDSKTATEASEAIKVSNKKQQEKKVDIATNENSFLTWFMLLLQKLLETSKTTHGMCMEAKPYTILFDALKKQGYSLLRFGAKSNSTRVDFPTHIEGKTKHVSDSVVYNAIKNSKEFKVFSADRKRYLHYANNYFYVFHVADSITLDKETEKVELKKLEAIESVKREQEKETLAKKEATKTETKKDEIKK